MLFPHSAVPRAGVFNIPANSYHYFMDFAQWISHPLIICLIVFAVLVEVWLVWKTTAANKKDPPEQAPEQTDSLLSAQESPWQENPSSDEMEALARAVEDMHSQIKQDREADQLKFEDLNKTIQSLKIQRGQESGWEQRISALEQDKAALLSRLRDMDEQLTLLVEKDAKIRKNPVLKTLNDLLGR